MLHVSYTKSKGGAGIAFQNFVRILKVPKKQIRYVYPFRLTLSSLLIIFKIAASRIILFFCYKGYPGEKLSLGWFNSGILNNDEDLDEKLHIHWFQNETISIKRLISHKSKSVITLHDEWLYSALEHYKTDLFCEQGFRGSSLRVLLRKYLSRKNIKIKTEFSEKCFNKFIITVPSKWLMRRAKESKILKEFDVRVIPNPIDIDVFTSNKHKRKLIREKYNIDSRNIVFVSGAATGASIYIKGFDLLNNAFTNLSQFIPNKVDKKIVWIRFGGNKYEDFYLRENIRVISVGNIKGRSDLANIYNIGDFAVVPSRYEAFGQVCAEAMSCQLPTIAFRNTAAGEMIYESGGGLVSGIEDKNFDCTAENLTNLLLKACRLGNLDRLKMGKLGREYIKSTCSHKNIKVNLNEIYSELN